MIASFLRPILLGTLVGILGCLAVLFVLAALATAVDFPPSYVVPLSTVAAAVGAFLGSVVGAAIAKRNGWLVGLLSSVILSLLITMIGVGACSPIDGGFLLSRTLIMAACGIIGGILAVNIGKKNRKR